ncbi:MAG: glycosyltransferase, partial [Rikenellaceae bacterium]
FDRVHSSKFIFSTHFAKVGIIILLGGLNAYTYKYIWNKHNTKIISITNPITVIKESGRYAKNKEIIYVGRIEYNQKRVFRLIDIWKELEDDYPEWRLSIVGDGPDRADLQNRINVSGLQHIKIEGFQNPVEYYQRAQLLILVSEYEGLPLVLAESMSCSVIPIIYGSYPSAYDIISDGNSGFITPQPYDKMQIVEKLRLLMDNDDLRAKMANKALLESRKFELQTVVNEWELLFKSL